MWTEGKAIRRTNCPDEPDNYISQFYQRAYNLSTLAGIQPRFLGSFDRGLIAIPTETTRLTSVYSGAVDYIAGLQHSVEDWRD